MMTAPKTIGLAFLGAASALILALPVQAQPRQSSCFRTSEMRNHTIDGDKTLYFDVGGRSVFRAQMSNGCFAGASSSDPIVLQDRAGTGRICSAIELDVSSNGNRCIVSNLSKLTPDEVAALPKKMKP